MTGNHSKSPKNSLGVTTKIKKFFSDLYKLLDIEDIALSSKEAYKNELKKGVGSQIGK